MKKILPQAQESFRGRGAGDNPSGRFEEIHYSAEPPADHLDEEIGLKTEFFPDHAKTILAQNESPDISFRFSLNPYRGCEHGCIYCYARPTHEYLGLSAGLDFESKIFVKHEAPELLRKALSAKSWEPQQVTLSGVTDCYQPAEKKFRLTRQCLEVFYEFKNPVSIITKNRLVTRDLDVLSEMAKEKLAAVFVSVTTLDSHLARILEPRASMPLDRMETIATLAAAGVPTGVMVAPVIPALNDAEIPAILHASARAGARFAGFTVLRLPHGVKDLFFEWLQKHFPDRVEKIQHRLESMRDGKLSDSTFGRRMRGSGAFAEQIADLFKIAARKSGFGDKHLDLDTSHFRVPAGPQLCLF